jgi:hypothetical protein
MGIKLRTDWNLKPGGEGISHHSKILLLGSCFSEHMAQKLKFSGFNVLENPHGILFHPLAIERSVSDCVAENQYGQEDLLHNGESWVSLNHHGRFNNSDPELAVESINSEIREAHRFLQKASHVIITLGTSWVYRHRKQDVYVANFHKIPQKEFSKELLSQDVIRSSLERSINLIQTANPEATIVLTVSPVRHVKDGIIENTRSKARLHEAIHHLTSEEKSIFYFPSYELMMDDLRDYRFYKKDLVHPNDTAVEYIWEKFVAAWIDPESEPLMTEAQSIHRALEHRPLNADSKKQKDFRTKIEERINKLEKSNPQLKIYQKAEESKS